MTTVQHELRALSSASRIKHFTLPHVIYPPPYLTTPCVYLLQSTQALLRYRARAVARGSDFGFECPRADAVHCQCANTLDDSSSEPVANCQSGHSHCTGPYTQGDYNMGEYGYGSVYNTQSVSYMHAFEMVCKRGGAWVRPGNDVANSVNGVGDCASQCADHGYTYFGLECPRADTVHCQCANTLAGSSGQSTGECL